MGSSISPSIVTPIYDTNFDAPDAHFD
jgi:hypothetical protein